MGLHDGNEEYDHWEYLGLGGSFDDVYYEEVNWAIIKTDAKTYFGEARAEIIPGMDYLQWKSMQIYS